MSGRRIGVLIGVAAAWIANAAGARVVKQAGITAD
jgi:hypothetical protein